MPASCPILRSLKRWQAIDNCPQDRCCLSGAAARDGVPDRLDGDAVLQGEAQHHGGVAGCALDVLPGLAAVDEDFARRAVGIESDGDRERLVPEPQVEGLCGAGAGGGLAASRGPFHIVAAKRPANKFLQILARLGRGDLPAKPLAEIVYGAADCGW